MAEILLSTLFTIWIQGMNLLSVEHPTSSGMNAGNSEPDTTLCASDKKFTACKHIFLHSLDLSGSYEGKRRAKLRRMDFEEVVEGWR